MIRLALALLLAASAALTPLAVAQATPAVPALSPVTTADEDAAPVRIVLETLSPAIPGERSTLRIRGRVVNASDTVIEDISVQLRRSSLPLPTRADIDTAADAATEAEGREPTDVPLPGTVIEVTDRLPAGEFASFSMRVPVSSLGFTEPGAYAFALEAKGREPGVDEFEVRQGMLRTFLPWFPRGAAVEPVSLAWLWPLAGWPAQSVSGVLLDNQTPEELQPDGRLGELVTIGQRHQATVSWIADPSLLQTIQGMAQGYRVVQDRTIVVGTEDAAAATWLEQVARATRVTGVQTLPYADVDASSLTQAGMSTDVVRAVTQGPRVASTALGDQTDGQVYWAPFGRMDQPALDVLASAGVTTVVLSGDAMPATDGQAVLDGQAIAALPTDAGAIRAVLTDPGLTRLLAAPPRTASEVITTRQRFLAETASVALTLQEAGAPDRTLVAAPPTPRWTAASTLLTPLLRATRSAPWLQPVTLSELLTEPTPTTSRRRGGYGEKARADELTRRYVAAIARANEDLSTFTSIIDNPTGVTEPFSEALLRASSSAWRSQPATGTELLESIQVDLDAQTAKVRVLSEGAVTLSGDSGKVPVTIANDLDRSVTVGVVLQGRPSLRLDSRPIEGVQIEAGKMASVDLSARVVGGDPLAVDVQLLGPDGEEYGSPAEITVSSTAYARAAAWVVALAFVAIVVFVIVGIVRRIHKARMASSRTAAGT
ncbi:MAG TPA: hypothetical protein DCQ36_09615 [Actinobacteria bacterium]|nr:hypothetical protein [Actinomycetota bacterium]